MLRENSGQPQLGNTSFSIRPSSTVMNKRITSQNTRKREVQDPQIKQFNLPFIKDKNSLRKPTSITKLTQNQIKRGGQYQGPINITKVNPNTMQQQQLQQNPNYNQYSQKQNPYPQSSQQYGQDQQNYNYQQPLSGLGIMMGEQQNLYNLPSQFQQRQIPKSLGGILGQQHDPFSQGMGGFGGGMQPTTSSQGLNQFQQNRQNQQSLSGISGQQNPYSTYGQNQQPYGQSSQQYDQDHEEERDQNTQGDDMGDLESRLNALKRGDQNQGNFARGGHVTRPRQQESTFDMNRVLQMLDFLRRGMV